MMKFLCALAFFSFVAAASADVVRLAPNFTWDGPRTANSLRALKGQPVVLLIAKSTRTGAFRKQVAKLRELYQEFASRKVVFAAAIADGSSDVRSDIPFAFATNGAQVAGQFDAGGNFTIVLIGRDGNIDYQTERVIPASRIREVIGNSFAEQSDRRK